MKLKCLPEDFRVEELSLVRPGGGGRYTYYRLTKRDLGTLEAVEAICRRWNLSGRRVSYAGLKDRHARTVQYLTIADGPSRSINTTKFDLEPVGRLDHAYSSRDLRGNRFELILRGLTDGELDLAVAEIEAIPKVGLPNYFDDQRFGSVGQSGDFVAQAWLLAGHERALRLALAEPNPFDRSAIKSREGHPPQSLGALGGGEGVTAAFVNPQHRDLPGQPSDGLPWCLRPPAPRVANALFLGIPEPPVEPGASTLARIMPQAPIHSFRSPSSSGPSRFLDGWSRSKCEN